MITCFVLLPGTLFWQPLININVLTVFYILSWQRSPLLLVLFGYRSHFTRDRPHAMQQRGVARAITDKSPKLGSPLCWKTVPTRGGASRGSCRNLLRLLGIFQRNVPTASLKEI